MQVRDLLPFAFLDQGGQQLSVEAWRRRGIVHEHRQAGGFQTTPVRSTSNPLLSSNLVAKIMDNNSSNYFSDVGSHLAEYGRDVKKKITCEPFLNTRLYKSEYSSSEICVCLKKMCNALRHKPNKPLYQVRIRTVIPLNKNCLKGKKRYATKKCSKQVRHHVLLKYVLQLFIISPHT